MIGKEVTLHPQCEAFLNAVAAADRPPWQDMEVNEAREIFDSLPVFGEVVELPSVEDASVANVPVRIFKPDTSQPLDVLVYFHGGGWVLGGVHSHDALCRRLAKHAGVAVVSVDYRRPPESPFPAAIDDCYAVCEAIASGNSEAGLTQKVVVAGDSAGGNLSAAVSLRARDESVQWFRNLAGQVLIYPVLDSSTSSSTYEEYAEGFGLTRATMQWFWCQYLGSESEVASHNPYASPMHSDDLSGLPRTHVLIAQYDVLRAEAEEFVRRLKVAGVETTVEVAEGMLHGYIHFAGAFDEAAPATERLAQKIQAFLG